MIGGIVGAIAGYFRGVVDGVSMRVVDLFFAFPAIILAMVVTAVLGRGLQNAALAIVIVAWPAYARVVRGLVLSIGDSEYVAVGAAARRVVAADALPRRAAERRRARCSCSRRSTSRPRSCSSPASRSSASARSRRTPSGARWSPTARSTSSGGGSGTFPGLAIFTAVLAFNFLGDSLRDLFDPQTSWRRRTAG